MNTITITFNPIYYQNSIKGQLFELLSLLVFLIAIWQFARSTPSSEEELTKTRTLTAVFAILHYIHLFLLMMNVKLNAVTLIPHKLAGGALAYLMILLYPLFFERIKNNNQQLKEFAYYAFAGQATWELWRTGSSSVIF